jgi:hypothetical protein
MIGSLSASPSPADEPSGCSKRRSFSHSGGTAPDLHRSSPLCPRGHPRRHESYHQLSTYANSSGATMVASDSITNFGVSIASFSQVIFSFGDAPEYDP